MPTGRAGLPTGDRPTGDLAVLFDRHGRALLHYCARRVGPDQAEDVVAQTFLTAHAARHRFDPSRADPLPWLYGIATNLLRRHRRDEIRAYRALARAGTVEVAPEDGAERATERVDAERVRRHLASVLAALPRRQRDVLLLYAVAELEYAEIAAALRIPLGSVRSALHRARTRVRAALPATSTEVDTPPMRPEPRQELRQDTMPDTMRDDI